MANPPPPYDNITGISRTVMKDNAQESIANYNGNARPGEIVVNLTTNDVYIGNTNGDLNLLVIGGGSGNSEPAGPVGAIQYNSGGNLFGGTANVTVSGTGVSVVGNVTAGNIVTSNIVENGSGNILVTGNLLPTANTWNLGLPGLPWQEAYFGPQSITILDESGNIGNSVVIQNIAANIVLSTTGLTINEFGTTNPIFRIEALTGRIFSDAETIISNDDNSSNVTSGSLQTAGGAGIAKNLYVGNNIVTNGDLTFTGGGIRQTGNEDLFITAVDNDGVTISSIGLMPNNKHTRLEQWSSQYSESWTTADWATGTYTVESGQGVVRFTNAANIISFVDSLYGSERIFFSVNGGPQLVSDGFNDGSGNIEFYTPTLPATNPTTVTTFDYYYSYESGLDIDYNSEEFNIFGDNVNINIETVGQKLINIKSFNDLNLESRNLFTLKNHSANNGIQIQTNASNASPTWEFGADGTTTFPNGNVTLLGNLSVSGNITYMPTYGQFWSNLTHTVNSTNTAYNFLLNNTDGHNNIQLGTGAANSRIIINKTGLYNIQFSVQIDKTFGGGGATTAYIWFKKNGTAVPDSGGFFTLDNTVQTVQSWNIMANVTAAGDYYEIAYAATNTHYRFPTLPGNVSIGYPASPSIIVTVTPVGA
jgi:hypothetical protein